MKVYGMKYICSVLKNDIKVNIERYICIIVYKSCMYYYSFPTLPISPSSTIYFNKADHYLYTSGLLPVCKQVLYHGCGLCHDVVKVAKFICSIERSTANVISVHIIYTATHLHCVCYD